MRLAVRIPRECPDSNPLGPSVPFQAQLRSPASPRGSQGHMEHIWGELQDWRQEEGGWQRPSLPEAIIPQGWRLFYNSKVFFLLMC